MLPSDYSYFSNVSVMHGDFILNALHSVYIVWFILVLMMSFSSQYMLPLATGVIK